MKTCTTRQPAQRLELLRDRVGSSGTNTRDVVVVIPTYNEAGNVRAIVRAVLASCDRLDVLIVDDHSPDGTGRIAEQLAEADSRVHVLHRRGPRGLGAAYMAGFRWALRQSYDRIVQMDADFSHDPRCIPGMLAESEAYDLVIGSRYCQGGRTVGWPWRRQILSRAANLYARMLLGSRILDLTGGFKCWRREVLERIDFARLRCDGYAFQVEMNHLAARAGSRIREIPITFRERAEDVSKMSRAVARKAAGHTAALAWDRLKGQPHPALLPDRHKPAASITLSGQEGKTRRQRRVLVMCLGGIGDTVLSFAMLRQLRQRLPEARLTALAMWRQSAELIRDLGVFDEILQHNFQTDRWWRSIAQLVTLHFRRFDTSILVFPTNRREFNLAAWLIHAKRRIGHGYRDSNPATDLRWLLTDRIEQTRGTHNVDENLRLLGSLPEAKGIRQWEDASPPDIRLGPLSRRYHTCAERLLADAQGPFVGIHAGTNPYKNMAARRWPPERFAELCRLIREHLGATPLLFGAGEEVALNELIADASPAALVIMTSSIRHTAAVMQRCSAFVSNDSALAHVASALDVPTVMIVGPTDPGLIRPYGGRGVAVTVGLSCSPCYRPCPRPLQCSCARPYACLSDISPEKVLERIASVWPGRPERNSDVSGQGRSARGTTVAEMLPIHQQEVNTHAL